MDIQVNEDIEVKSLINKGDKYYGINIIKVTTDRTSQKEIRINLFPICFEISYLNRRYIKIGIRIYKFLVGLEFDYASV